MGPPQQASSVTLSSDHLPTLTHTDYRKTIRRDPAQFKPLNDKRHWATWHLQFVATARAQDLQDVLDPLYVPRTPDERAVFLAKQEYLYAVFVQNLLTDEGKTYVQGPCPRTAMPRPSSKSLLIIIPSLPTPSLLQVPLCSSLTSFKLGAHTMERQDHRFLHCLFRGTDAPLR
jgi:hypothetical protein